MSNPLGCWTAGTSDGRCWSQADAALQGQPCSPWRALEGLCQRDGLRIVWAQVALGDNWARVEAEGYPLVCGELLCEVLSLTGDSPRRTRYRWIMRQEPTRRLWTIIDGAQSWQYEAPPGGPLQCPSPE